MTRAPSVYQDLSVRENLRYFAGILAAPKDDVQRVTAEVGLDARTTAEVGDLSGGERSRVSLATALLGRRRLLVLDEPTVGAGSGAAPGSVGAVLPTGGSGRDPPGIQPRDGRGLTPSELAAHLRDVRTPCSVPASRTVVAFDEGRFAQALPTFGSERTSAAPGCPSAGDRPAVDPKCSPHTRFPRRPISSRRSPTGTPDRSLRRATRVSRHGRDGT